VPLTLVLDVHASQQQAPDRLVAVSGGLRSETDAGRFKAAPGASLSLLRCRNENHQDTHRAIGFPLRAHPDPLRRSGLGYVTRPPERTPGFQFPQAEVPARLHFGQNPPSLAPLSNRLPQWQPETLSGEGLRLRWTFPAPRLEKAIFYTTLLLDQRARPTVGSDRGSFLARSNLIRWALLPLMPQIHIKYSLVEPWLR
jgi:hypothetical protein